MKWNKKIITGYKELYQNGKYEITYLIFLVVLSILEILIENKEQENK